MGFDVFPHNLYDIKNRQWWLTTGAAARMNNVTTSTHKVVAAMWAKLHALRLGYHKTHRAKSTQHTHHWTPQRHNHNKSNKKVNCTITKKQEGKDLKGQFGCLSEN